MSIDVFYYFLKGVFHMQAIDRMMMITKAISEHNQTGVTISQLTEHTELALATLHRILHSLVEHRLIQFDATTKRYTLGDAWMQYGLQVYDQFDYVSKIRPILDDLAELTQESVYMHKPMEDESMIVERLDSPNSRIHIVDRLGLRTAMPEGATNHIILAHHIILEKKENVFNVDTSFLQKIIVDGFVLMDDAQKETVSFATPIVTKNQELLHVISLSVLAFSLTEERTEWLTKQLLETRKLVEETLYFM